MILHPETKVAYSRNSLPSLRGRPSSSLLDRALSEPAGGHNVMYKSIAVSPLTLTASLFSIYLLPLYLRSSALPWSASTPALLLVTLVAISYPCWYRLSALLWFPLSQYAHSIVGLILSPYLEI